MHFGICKHDNKQLQMLDCKNIVPITVQIYIFEMMKPLLVREEHQVYNYFANEISTSKWTWPGVMYVCIILN